MMNLPIVTVMLITYKRTDYAVRTVLGIQKHLRYPNLMWHIADDGSQPEHVRAITNVMTTQHPVSISNAERRGAGHSMNLGQARAWNNGDFILWMEDDWELQEDFDLVPLVRALQERQDIGTIRLAYISPPLQGTLISAADNLYWKLHRSPECLYTYSGQPQLRHRRFFDAYGPHQTGLGAGDTEIHMCWTVIHHPDGPDVAIPAWTGIWGPFKHIGTVSIKNEERVG